MQLVVTKWKRNEIIIILHSWCAFRKPSDGCCTTTCGGLNARDRKIYIHFEYLHVRERYKSRTRRNIMLEYYNYCNLGTRSAGHLVAFNINENAHPRFFLVIELIANFSKSQNIILTKNGKWKRKKTLAVTYIINNYCMTFYIYILYYTLYSNSPNEYHHIILFLYIFKEMIFWKCI